jgi:hypothetical protein
MRISTALWMGAIVFLCAFAPTPTGPVFGRVPGALPPDFHYAYDSAYTGWPVAPVHAQHPVRGSFLDPRGVDDTGTSGYHFGIDVSVDDRHPDPSAPKGMSHAVYALESGTVDRPNRDLARACLSRRLEVGHFDYWHVSPIVSQGQHVRAGEQIGWSCLGVWHVHVSEWQRYRNVRIWVNPLHKGGRLIPYVDTAAPVVSTLAFHTPPKTEWSPTRTLAQPDTSKVLEPTALHGLVELRARVADPQSFLGFLADNPAWPTEFAPYRLSVTLTSLATGRTIMRRTSFRADQLPQTPYVVHYAPGTMEDENMKECVGPPQHSHCAGTYWFRPFSRFTHEYWDTKLSPNGAYRITIRAYDVAGNVGTRTATVTVKN